MKEIREKIQMILEAPNENNSEIGHSPEWTPSEIDDDFGELYTDLYILIRNVDDFFGENTNPKALDLVDSFLLESLITLKQNHDIIRVESGDDYVKATAFTPDGETAGYLFDSAVQINTMLDIYNKTLAENNMPRIDVGIGMATFPGNPDDEETPCHCHDEGHECDNDEEECLSHGHGIENLEFGYATDFENTALHMATIANSDELDPIVINEPTYSLMSDSETLKDFLDHNLEKVIFEGEDFSVFHGNIVSEEE